MTLRKQLVAALLCGLASPGFACKNPPLVQIPAKDGLTESDVQRVRNEVNAYFEAMKTYTSCLQTELAAAGGDNAPQLTKASYIVRNNGAVAEVDAVLKLFTEIDPTGSAARPATPPPESGGRRNRNN
jgi:hypothetical protein